MNASCLKIALILSAVLYGSAAAQQTTTPASEEAWIPLYETVDAELQAALEARIAQQPAWQRLVTRRRLAIGVVDLGRHDATPKFARINGNQMMYAASLPKIAILLAAYASFEDGSLEETAELHQDLTDMIRVSSNAAATRVLDAVGMSKLEQVMRDPQFGFYDESRGGGLWVGKRYASTGPRHGDPLLNISHGATVTQVSRFYYQLAEGHLINAERSEQMLADLADPGIHHKFVAAIERRAPLARIFRKSGTWQNWHADSVLVRGPQWRNYILVALVESPDGEQILRELVPAVEELLNPAHN